jgi:hypothetical protein
MGINSSCRAFFWQKLRSLRRQYYKLSPQITFKGVGVGLGEIASQIRFERLEPTIQAFGAGENHFYWVFTPAEHSKAFSGTKEVLFGLDVPKGSQSLSGLIYYKAVIEDKNWIGQWSSQEAKTDFHPIQWNLKHTRLSYEVKGVARRLKSPQ